MKNKTSIKALFWILFIAVIFQFSLMIPTTLVERTAASKATMYAQTFPIEQQQVVKRSYKQAYLENIATEVIFRIPYIANLTYNDLKDQQLQLGLDLKGGMQLTLRLNTADFLRDLAGDVQIDKFDKSLEYADKEMGLSQEEYIDAFFEHYQQLEPKESIIRLFSRHPQINLIDVPSIASLKMTIQQLITTAMEDTQFLLEQRINGHGLSQTKITKDEKNNFIHVEVPGAQNPERIRSILVANAALEFWDTYRITDSGITEAFYAADKQLQSKEGNIK